MKHKIFWENNSRIKGIVPAEQIIKKTQNHALKGKQKGEHQQTVTSVPSFDFP